MRHRTWRLPSLLSLFTSSVFCYVDFGSQTQPLALEPAFTFTIPRPHQLPDDVWMRYGEYHSHITAIAPSVTLLTNGSHSTSWSLHFNAQPSRTVSVAYRDKDLRRRGVFSGDPSVPTCKPCDANGNPTDGGTGGNSTNSGSPTCTVANYNGIFRDGGFATSTLPDYCFNAGYAGPLLPSALPTDAGLPCCPVCYPPGTNTSVIITTGVLSTSSPLPGGNNGGAPTITVTRTETATQIITRTQVTLSIETITPTSPITGSPTVTQLPNTIIGCGTAHGCGTVIGSGTVYLAPFGFPAVTSSGTVSGCAPTIIGCGTLIATTGTFTGTARITACGEGTGSATMIGSGTVWPAGFMDLVSFVSSGTVTGSGRVRGCGYLTGTGTFTVSEPFTTSIGTPTVTPTVNVYVSYCPPEAGVIGGGGARDSMMRLAGNFSEAREPGYVVDGVLATGKPPAAGNSTVTGMARFNGTVGGNNSTTSNNLLCRICPEDSGICCPPFSDCGADGHCPWVALEGSGYARFGVNLVDVRNSSQALGMSGLPDGAAGYERLKAPGLPRSAVPGADGRGVDSALSAPLRKRGVRRAHDHFQGHLHRPRGGLAHRHGHGR